MTAYFTQYDDAAREIIRIVGNNVVIAAPLGLGKPVGIINALYREASHNTNLQLTIITGLTFARPTFKTELEQRFVEPLLDRILGDYEEPLYEKARACQQLPANINVIEFFLTPGKFLHNSYVQRNYINSSYTNVVRDAINLSVNVLAQLVSPCKNNSDLYSLSCNTDLFHDLHQQLMLAQAKGKAIAIVGEVNANLPYMYGQSAEVSSDIFSVIAKADNHLALFAVPRDELSVQDHMIGLYSSTLVVDDGCLQIGIGKLSNALAYGLIFRQHYNDDYQTLIKQLTLDKDFAKVITTSGSLAPFNKGLYASTEMLSDEYLQLYHQGILKKKVYDHAGLQKLLNEQLIAEDITPEFINTLIEHSVIHHLLTAADLAFLQRFGIVKPDITMTGNQLHTTNGVIIPADLSHQEYRDKFMQHCLGDKLSSGKIVHAGFFFGSVDLYEQLHHMPYPELKHFEMTAIARTNALQWSPELLKLQRINARFVNSSLMVTLLGGAISDGLANFQEVSGVGGQYNFVSMANELPDAMSMITCRSTRQTRKGMVSNIVWEYPNNTLPRYLRDVVITEYGIADCRSKTDSDVIKAVLNITDSRFQAALLQSAKKAGKIARDYQIPASYRNNTPDRLEHLLHHLRQQGYFKPYPFGSDLTPLEEKLARLLIKLNYQSPWQLVCLLLKSCFIRHPGADTQAMLQRMGLDKTRNLMDVIYRQLLKALSARSA